METDQGKMGLTCISMAMSDFYSNIIYNSHSKYHKTRISLHVRDSKGTVLAASAAALDLLKNVGVEAIIGPPTSMQADFLINLGEIAQVPILSFSATSTFLSSLRSDYFFRATFNDSTQVDAIASLIHSFGWREVVPIYVDNEFGAAILPFLANALQNVDVRISHRTSIHPLASDDEILIELYKLMTMQTRVFIVHMDHKLGFRLFNKAKQIGMMNEGYAWITTNGITNSLSIIDPSNLVGMDSMHGVLGIKPHVPRTRRLKDFVSRWKNEARKSNLDDTNLNIFRLWAYDAATALAIVVEKAYQINSVAGKTRGLNITTNLNSSGTNDLETIGVSQMGKYISQELSRTRFRGIGGDFHIINGELQSSAFQIVNFIDDLRERGIGFWTPTNGISRQLENNSRVNSNTKLLKPVIWPGEGRSKPRGWDIPLKGKRLRVGVPVNEGDGDLVKVIREENTNVTKVTGYCIDVFDAVMARMPYYVPYDYIPFENPSGKAIGNYNDLVYQVFLGNYDVVVGDVTILANRSLYVDFTLPYMESRVMMIMPYMDKKTKNPLAFLKPLTWDLWVTSGCFFIFVGFVIWILEHRSNGDFGGSQLRQVSTSFWFSFSIMFLTHREQVVSNLARLVVIIWCFVVLILTQSYTASLTSWMTVQQLEPSITDVQDLINRGQSVGYPKGSFVLTYLTHMGFKDSQLKMYKSTEELDAIFSNKSILAAFDESPYLKQFVLKYCSKYIMDMRPISMTGGFGFGFPKGSPLVPDVSREILNVIENDQKIEKLEKALFKDCQHQDSKVDSNRLSLGNFWALFLIVGVASSFAVIIFLAMLIYEHRHFLMQYDLKSWLKRMKYKGKKTHKDNMDLHQIENDHHDDIGEVLAPVGNVTFTPSPGAPFIPSRSSISEDMDFVDTSGRERETYSTFVPGPSSFGHEIQLQEIIEVQNQDRQGLADIQELTLRIH
ncbi:glutamate receptor 2.7-like [Impatiens glandulifera]|uniref:glutamate receptor 2.7-like n=1 Tax=Impatiens glandulifera TaxID=253017 RepID=UPI001FB0BDCC|nr:glutamate receptor 2.7-like [Impatiens glandulifera]